MQNTNIELSDVAYEVHYKDEANGACDDEIPTRLELEFLNVVL